MISTRAELPNFEKNDAFKPDTASVFIFIACAIVAWAFHTMGQMVFPGQHTFPFLSRSVLSVAAIFFLYWASAKMLAKNQLSVSALGIAFTSRTVNNMFVGLALATATILLSAIILYVFQPFHFEAGPLNNTDALKQSVSMLFGNTLEELTFRGFPLLILSGLFGWRKAVWILAFAFGLFHIPGLGFGEQGLKMMFTTAAYSFIFCYAYILTKSLFTAVILHWFSNVLLHIVTGLSGANNALLMPKFHSWLSFDIGTISFLVSTVLIAYLLFLRISRRKRSVALPAKNRID